MSATSLPASWKGDGRSRAPDVMRRLALVLGSLTLLLVLAAALSAALWKNPPTAPIALGGGVLTLAALALVIVRNDLAVFVGFLLLAVVIVEPAPSDALFILVMVVAALTGRFRVRRLARSAQAIAIAFLVLNLVSFSGVISFSAAGRFFLITLYLLTFSLWLAGYVDRAERSRRLVRAYAAAAVASAVAASAATLVHFPGSTLLLGDGQRGKGLFKDPNVYGPFLVPIALILAEELLNPRLLQMRRSLRYACFLALCLGVIFSYSRAAWLNLAVGIVVLIACVVMRRPDRRAISLVLTVVIGGATIAGAVVATGSLGFLKERAHLQSYDSSRFAAQATGVATGLKHPFGVGPGQFDVVSTISSHSLYVRSLSEQGPLGLLVIIALVLVTAILGVMNLLRGRDTYGIGAAALLAAWCGVAANSFFVDTLHWRHLWLIAALIWAGSMRERNRAQDVRGAWSGPVQAAVSAP